MQHLTMKNTLKEIYFMIENCEHVNANRKKHMLANTNVKDSVLVKKCAFGFAMSLRNMVHDSHHAHSLDATTTDSDAIATTDVQNKQSNAHSAVQTRESRMD